MTDITVAEKDISALLRAEYKKLKSGWVSIIKAPIDKVVQVNLESLRILTDELGYKGIYITVDKPYSELVKMLTENSIDTDKLFFVDAISQMYEKVPTDKKCRYVSGPLNIDAITAAVYDTIPKIQNEKKFVFIDSISTILLYNSLPRTVRFSKFITEKIKKMDISGIMVSISTGIANDKLIAELQKTADTVIDIK